MFKEWLLSESKQDLVNNLKYPPIVAKLFYEKFGNLAPLIAKWFRDYHYDSRDRVVPDNWWLQRMGDLFRTPSLYDLTSMYTAAEKGSDEYRNYLIKKLEQEPEEEFYDDYALADVKVQLKSQIAAKLSDDYFFKSYPFVQDVISGNIRDLAPYKSLNFWDALQKYEKKKIFNDKAPIKVYKNGYKWIDVGPKCDLIGNLMKNCGSSGVMSMDKDRTMLALFDSNNIPHIVVTYSPNEKRISGDQGIASTEAKTKYHKYILDLAKTLGVEFDAMRSRSTFLGLKYKLKDKATGITPVGDPNSVYDRMFKFIMNGKEYYTNNSVVLSRDDLNLIQNGIAQGTIQLRNKQKSLIRNAFHYMNQPIIQQAGIKYIPLQSL